MGVARREGEGGNIDSRAQRPVSAGRRAQATARPERRAPPPAPEPRRLRTPRVTPRGPGPAPLHPTLSDGTLTQTYDVEPNFEDVATIIFTSQYHTKSFVLSRFQRTSILSTRTIKCYTSIFHQKVSC